MLLHVSSMPASVAKRNVLFESVEIKSNQLSRQVFFVGGKMLTSASVRANKGYSANANQTQTQ